MNYLENGHHFPSLPVLHRIADVLQTDIAQLVGREKGQSYVKEHNVDYHVNARYAVSVDDKPSGYEANVARIVRLEPSPHPLSNRMVVILDDVIQVFLALEDICDVQKCANVPLRLQVPRTEEELTGFVSRVRHFFGISDAVIFDYLELFENQGLRIVFLPLGDGVQSVSCYDQACDNAFLFISNRVTTERKIFRLAYELGRIFLYNAGSPGVGALDAEHAACRFAALFLMPEEAVLTSVRQVGVHKTQWNWEILMRLKHRFGVSAESFLYRLVELDLITPELSRSLRQQICQYYEKNRNGEPDHSRRILTENGRLGDLVKVAAIKVKQNAELAEIHQLLKTRKIKMP